ncbi:MULTISPECIES: hypothetical protein [Salinimonas]|uniref:Uncharacterized protein n=2 Tax=Salinimonas TaxID=288793 RepID=A0A5B7YJN9_9ALTE|nr:MULTISPECIES: hypothetical protein [Salinimonas]MBD3587522.1 hypothetical protein [Salinimonas profundi]QCZ95566.1 hypothetical protein FBQ74_18775 [Salinimonas iocasae]
MRTDIPTVNARGSKTVMGFVMDAAADATRDMPFPSEQARHAWIESHFDQLLKQGSRNFCAAGNARLNLTRFASN